MSQKSKLDIRAIIAVAWLLSAVALTFLIYDSLGARGVLWLAIHHLLCVIGCGHELRRHFQAQKESQR